MNKKELLDELTKKYEIPEFISHDPVKFPHKFYNQRDQEISGLIASSLAYGKRENILVSVEKILEIMNYDPHNFVLEFNYDKDKKLFEGFIHRYSSGKDIALLIFGIKRIIEEYDSLKNLFLEGFSIDDKNIKQALIHFVNTFRSYLYPEADTRGIYFLLPSPAKGSACKRLNMFLRWIVRPGPVDLHLWPEVPTSKLLIPLDIHVAKLSRKLGLTERKADDWKTAEEITENLKKFDPNDPAKYDFAIFGMGIYKESIVYLDKLSY